MIKCFTNTVAIVSAFFMLSIFLPAFAFVAVQATKIEAFGITQKPFTGLDSNINVDICYIDQYQNQIAGFKKTTKQFAVRYLEKTPEFRWSSSDSTVLAAKFKEVYSKRLVELGHIFKCCGKAKLLGITKIPAIVFANKYVVYGETDIARAYKAYQTFLSRSDVEAEKHYA